MPAEISVLSKVTWNVSGRYVSDPVGSASGAAAVVGASVMGASVMGASVAGASVTGASVVVFSVSAGGWVVSSTRIPGVSSIIASAETGRPLSVSKRHRQALSPLLNRFMPRFSS